MTTLVEVHPHCVGKRLIFHTDFQSEIKVGASYLRSWICTEDLLSHNYKIQHSISVGLLQLHIQVLNKSVSHPLCETDRLGSYWSELT